MSNLSSLSRRSFLSLSSGVAAAGLLGGISVPHALAMAGQSTAPNIGQRTLVVVDLQGGNDALNTLVPATGRYHDLRPGLALADDELLTFAGLDLGVHPSLARLEPFWDAGNLTALYGTGLPGQGRSHFVAQDAWRSARPGVPARSGWLGRWLEASDTATSDTATGDTERLRAIALGQSTLAVEGQEGRPVAIQSVSGFQLSPPRNNSKIVDAIAAMGAAPEAGLFGLAQSSLPATVAAVSELQQLIAGVESDDADVTVDDNQALFSATQAIIQGNLGTEVIYVTVDGFDHHALQAPQQAALLKLVADGISQLFAELTTSGHGDQTVVLVVSEFGRRAAENGSQGTDHGRGGLSLLLGPSVASSQLIGAPDLDDLDDGDLRIDIDARNIYDNALRWLGATDDQVNDVLGGEWTDISLF